MNTDNFTQYIADYSCLYTQTFLLLCFCIITISIVSNVFGNILILASVFRFGDQFTGSLYLLICNLAVSDLILGISLIMYPIEHFLPNLAEEKAFCYSRMCMLLIAFSSSVQSLLLISIDRFLAVMCPIRHYRLTIEQTRNIRLGLGLIWVISLSCGTLPVTANSKFRDEYFFCRNGLLLSKEIDILNASAVLVEFMVSLTLYVIVIYSIKRRTLTLTERTKRRLNVKTKRMILVFIVYACCWLPYIATIHYCHRKVGPDKRRTVLRSRTLGVNGCVKFRD